MARTEAINTFTDGLVMDLNEVNTPNSVLTDALNATIITYDGNEHLLQNDKGNYGLKNCKLPKYYVPVGMKEYGDILYIASYNPLTKKFQLGSFPSIKQAEEAEENTIIPEDMNDIDLLDFMEDSDNYYEIIKKLSTPKIFIDNSNKERFKIYPGDKIKIEIKDSSKVNNNENQNTRELVTDPHCYIEWGIISEESQDFKTLDGFDVKEYSTSKASPFEEAGWLAFRVCIAEINDINISNKILVNKTSDNNNSSLSFKVSVISDNDKFDDIEKDVMISVKIGEEEHIIYEGVKSKSPNGSIIKTFDINSLDINANEDTTVEITPEIIIHEKENANNVDSDTSDNQILEANDPKNKNQDKYIKYNTTYFTIRAEDVSSIGNIKLAENLWRYTVNEDSVDIEFDAIDPNGGHILPEDVSLKYKVRRLRNILNDNANEFNDTKEVENDTKTLTVEGIIGSLFLGDNNYIHISKNDISKIDEGDFKDDYFVVKIYADGFDNLSTYRIITTSDLMNDIDPSIKRMDRIAFSDWSKNLRNYISSNIKVSLFENASISNSDPEILYFGSVKEVTKNDGITLDLNSVTIKNFCDSVNTGDEGEIRSNSTLTVPSEISGFINMPNKGIWSGIYSDCTLELDDEVSISCNNGEFSNSTANNVLLTRSFYRNLKAVKMPRRFKLLPYSIKPLNINPSGEHNIVIFFTEYEDKVGSQGVFYCSNAPYNSSIFTQNSSGYVENIEPHRNSSYSQLTSADNFVKRLEGAMSSDDATMMWICPRVYARNNDGYDFRTRFGDIEVSQSYRSASNNTTVQGQHIPILVKKDKSGKISFFQLTDRTTTIPNRSRQYMLTSAIASIDNIRGTDQFHKSGLVRKIEFSANELNGFFYFFNEDGNINSSLTFKNGAPKLEINKVMEPCRNSTSFNAFGDLDLSNVHENERSFSDKINLNVDIRINTETVDAELLAQLNSTVNELESEEDITTLSETVANDWISNAGKIGETVFICQDSADDKYKNVAEFLNNGCSTNKFHSSDLIVDGHITYQGNAKPSKQISLGKISDAWI